MGPSIWRRQTGGAVPFWAAVALLLLAPHPAGGQRPAATPQRPSLSSNVWTVPRGLFELEAGLALAGDSGGIPLFAKYGLTESLELEAGWDAVRWLEEPGGYTASTGDLLLGARWRATGGEAPVQLALAGLLKLPTAGGRLGSGELDGTLLGIASVGLGGGWGLDLNLAWSGLGREGPGSLGQGQAIASLGIPLGGRWSSFLEAAYQRTAGQPEGGFVDAGLALAVTPRSVLDLAAGKGFSQGYPDWTFALGWTRLFARRR